MEEHDKPVRRVRAGQPAADLERWQIDLDDLPEEELPHWLAIWIVIAIVVIVALFVFGLVSVL